MPLTKLQTFGRAKLCQRETKMLCKNDLPVSKLTTVPEKEKHTRQKDRR